MPYFRLGRKKLAPTGCWRPTVGVHPKGEFGRAGEYSAHLGRQRKAATVTWRKLGLTQVRARAGVLLSATAVTGEPSGGNGGSLSIEERWRRCSRAVEETPCKLRSCFYQGWPEEHSRAAATLGGYKGRQGATVDIQGCRRWHPQGEAFPSGLLELGEE